MKRSPLRSKRPTPRRAQGRVKHVRTKPVAKAAPTAAEQRHMTRVAGLGCLVCQRPAELHHSMSAEGKVRRRDHRFVCPLCSECHRTGWGAVHVLGSETAFLETHGIDLGSWAVEAWRQSEELEA